MQNQLLLSGLNGPAVQKVNAYLRPAACVPIFAQSGQSRIVVDNQTDWRTVRVKNTLVPFRRLAS
jgi:hypothetical protein